MTLYISTTFIKNNTSLIKALEILKEVGTSSVEICSNHIYEKNLNYINKFNFNYIVHNYFPVPKKNIILNISSLDKNIRENSIKKIKDSIIFCSRLNSKLYTFHPGFVIDPIKVSKKNFNYDFVWKIKKSNRELFDKSKFYFLKSLDKIIEFAKKYKVPIAFETEGSYYKNELLIMQKPEEYELILNNYDKNDVGINLNIGHLNLSSNFYKFDKFDFINYISKNIVAMELSHNDGYQDQHVPLKPKGWYWNLINNKKFKKTYKILEFRNTSKKKLINNIKLFNKKNEF